MLFSPQILARRTGIAALPTGALGVWYADQYATSPRKNIPNEITKASSPVPSFINQFRQGDRIAGLWSFSGVVVTIGQTDSEGGTTAARFVGTGGSWSGSNSAPTVTLPAGTFTTVLVCKSNTGLQQTLKMDFDFGAGTVITVPAYGWARLAISAVKSAGASSCIRLTPDSGADVDIIIDRWECFPGASDPYAASTDEVFGGHLLLGTTAYDKVPAVAANEVDISVTNAQGQAFFDTAVSLASFTAFACLRKVGATPNVAGGNGIFTGAGIPQDGYGVLALFADINNGQDMFFSTAFTSTIYRQPFFPGVISLLDLLNNNYNVLVWKYDAATTTASFWINDVLVAGRIVSRSALAGFQGLYLNRQIIRSSCKWTSGAFYPSALSRANIESVVTVLKARAVTNSLTLDTTSRFLFLEGDSNTDGSAGTAPGGGSYPFLYVPNASQTFYGALFGQSGNKLADMAARAPILDASIPTVKGSRKFILSGMIGTNDGTLSFTQPAAAYSTSLLNYWAARKAAGFITVGIGILNRTDANAAAGFDAWRKAINTNLRAAVGTQLDAFVDVETDANIGAAAAPDDLTYFKADKVHLTVGTGTTGQAALEVIYRSAVNGL